MNLTTSSFGFPTLSMRATNSENEVQSEMPTYQNGAAAGQFSPNKAAPSLATIHGLNNFPASNSTNWVNFMPSFAEGDAFLAIYRNQMTPHFPFIVVEESVSAETLNLDKPFFYLCIIAVTKLNSSHQKALGKLIMQQLGERLFARGERNLDLLLGSLTYAAWLVFFKYLWFGSGQADILKVLLQLLEHSTSNQSPLGSQRVGVGLGPSSTTTPEESAE